MKRFFNIYSFWGILLIFLVNSCSSGDTIRIVEEVYPNGKEKTVKYYVEKGGKTLLVKQTEFYNNGNKHFEGTFSNDLKDGIWQYWYEDGTIWSEGEYRLGVANGRRNVYHANGQLYYTGKIKDDNRIGVWNFFNEEGRLIRQVNFSE